MRGKDEDTILAYSDVLEESQVLHYNCPCNKGCKVPEDIDLEARKEAFENISRKLSNFCGLDPTVFDGLDVCPNSLLSQAWIQEIIQDIQLAKGLHIQPEIKSYAHKQLISMVFQHYNQSEIYAVNKANAETQRKNEKLANSAKTYNVE